MTSDSCLVCRFYRQDQVTAPGDSGHGTCRVRSVPGSFPRRNNDDWCGEFQAAKPVVEAKPTVAPQKAK